MTRQLTPIQRSVLAALASFDGPATTQAIADRAGHGNSTARGAIDAFLRHYGYVRYTGKVPGRSPRADHSTWEITPAGRARAEKETSDAS